MARRTTTAKNATGGKKRPIETYEHKDKERANNPPVGLVTPDTDPDAGKKKTYDYDPHLDPQLQWAGKTEHTSFEIRTVSLHVHERISPRSIIEAVRKRNGDGGEEQLSLFDTLEENPPLREAIEFYAHAHNWSNRMIAGDSLLVMNSLLEKEGMAGKVQMVYLDPPYGIKYGSNFQPFVNKRGVKDGKAEAHAHNAAAYVELNPVRAAMVSAPWELSVQGGFRPEKRRKLSKKGTVLVSPRAGTVPLLAACCRAPCVCALP